MYLIFSSINNFNIMKILFYYLLVFIPIILVGFINKYIDTKVFLALLGLYIFIYHPLITFFRLKYLKIINGISKKAILYSYMSFINFKSLFLKQP